MSRFKSFLRTLQAGAIATLICLFLFGIVFLAAVDPEQLSVPAPNVGTIQVTIDYQNSPDNQLDLHIALSGHGQELCGFQPSTGAPNGCVPWDTRLGWRTAAYGWIVIFAYVPGLPELNGYRWRTYPGTKLHVIEQMGELPLTELEVTSPDATRVTRIALSAVRKPHGRE